MSAETRVVLVKPGDVLIFGNCGDIEWDARSQIALDRIKEKLDLGHVLIFEADIDLAAVPAEGWKP